MKNPAFLFYSKDFYEGTRLMLPEERACFVDLLIYQHQNGFIPNDPKRLTMYCSGISEKTILDVLQNKFTLCDTLPVSGWINQKMKLVMDNRDSFTKLQSINGVVGNFWKKAKSILSPKEYIELKELLINQSNDYIFTLVEDKKIDNAMLHAMRNALRTHIANANANKDINKDKGGVGGFEEGQEMPDENQVAKIPPDFKYVQEYFNIKGHPEESERFYDYYTSNGWKVGKNKMKDWKATVRNWLKNKNEYKNNGSNTNDPRSQKIGRTTVGAITDFINRKDDIDISGTVTG